MPINASAKSGAPRQNAPAGTHVARCYQIIDLGTHDKEWQGKKRKSHEIRVSWELPDEQADFGKGKLEPFAVHKTYTLSLSEKANLRHDLESWRGKPFTEAELESFDVCTVLGAPCMVTVVHVEKNGNTYANVSNVTSLPKALKATMPAPVNPVVEFSLDTHDENVFRNLPDFLKEIIQSSDEWKQNGATDPDPDERLMQEAQADDAAEDDIPF